MIKGENSIDEALIRTCKTHFPSSIVEEDRGREELDSSKSLGKNDSPKSCENDATTAAPASIHQTFNLTEDETDALTTMTFELVRGGFRKPQPSKSLLVRVAVINMFEDLKTSAGREQVEKILRDLLAQKGRKRQ